MEIIKVGRVIKCYGCEAVLRYSSSDISHNSEDGPMGEDYDYVVCPCCNQVIKV